MEVNTMILIQNTETKAGGRFSACMVHLVVMVVAMAIFIQGKHHTSDLWCCLSEFSDGERANYDQTDTHS